jgi:hypothetical protein
MNTLKCIPSVLHNIFYFYYALLFEYRALLFEDRVLNQNVFLPKCQFNNITMLFRKIRNIKACRANLLLYSS